VFIGYHPNRQNVTDVLQRATGSVWH
jgi:hypothetical protein